jgi:hypothetical protein
LWVRNGLQIDMANPPKNLVQPFSSKGLAIKVDPALIEPDQYVILTNFLTAIEGTLCPRLGTRRLTNTGLFTANAGQVASFTRLITTTINRVESGPPIKIYFLALNGQMYVSNTAVPAAGAAWAWFTIGAANMVATPGTPYTQQRFGSVGYVTQETSLSTEYFACPNGMYKASSTTLEIWGAIPPVQAAFAGNSATGTGPTPFVGVGVPYTYVYTYENSSTGYITNPSQVSLITGVTPNGHQILVNGIWSKDTQIDTINIYRAGGAFADDLYRLVGSIPNVVGGAGDWAFFDTLQDSAIAANAQPFLDNDPPIPSALNTPLVLIANPFVSGGGAPGENVIHVVPIRGPAAGLSALTVGSLVSIGTINNSNLEQVRVAAINIPLQQITVYLQLTHFSGELITCDTLTGAPATIVCLFGSSLYVAGDPNNPNTLYQSKPGLPESFPALNLETGAAQSIYISSPGDAIVGLIEYNGLLVVLNVQSIYTVTVFNGVMAQPVRTPAKRGCVNQTAYCRVSNEIWYVFYDGIYSFTGGAETWKSGSIDPLFNTPSSGEPWPYAPIDMRPGLGTVGSDVIMLWCTGLEVFMYYKDVNGASQRLRYHTKFDRWSIEELEDEIGTVSNCEITTAYVEPDTGDVFINKQVQNQGYINLDNTGTSDGWVSSPNDGKPFLAQFMQAPVSKPTAVDKLFSDIIVDTYNPTNTLTAQAYYDFSQGGSPTDLFDIPIQVVRTRNPFSLGASQGTQAYAAGILFTALTSGQMSLYSLTWNYWELAQYREGIAFDWDDLGYQEEKTLRWLEIEMSTSNVAATIQIQGDGVNLGPAFTITTTYQDRKRIIALPSNLTARMLRLVITPGVGGAVRYFSHRFEFVREPALLTVWDSYEWAPWNGYTFVKQMWLETQSTTPVTVTIYVDGDTDFFTTTIPAAPAPQRGVARFYLPSRVGNALNKSKTHRIVMASASGFRLYAGASKIEWMACGADQRSTYQQSTLSEVVTPPIAA